MRLQEPLDFGVGVRADFAVQIDFFVLRCGPFHGYDSLALVEHRKNNTETEEQKAEFKLASESTQRQGGASDEQEAKTCHNSS